MGSTTLKPAVTLTDNHLLLQDSGRELFNFIEHTLISNLKNGAD